eukprot:gene18558-22156_t
MERSPCTLSDEELAGRLHRLLAESDLQSTTTRELRSKLEEETSSCLNHRKQFIKSEVRCFEIIAYQGACELSPALLEALTSIWQALSTHSNATTSEFPTSKPKVLELLWRYIHFRKLGAPPVRRTDGISVSTIRLDKILAEVFRDPLDCYSLVAQLCQHMRPQRAGLVPLVDGASVAGSVPLVDGASVAGSVPLVDGASVAGSVPLVDGASVAGSVPLVDGASVAGSVPLVDGASVAGSVPLVDGASVAGSVPLVDGASVAGSVPLVDGASVAGSVPLVDGASVAGSVPLVDGASVAGSVPLVDGASVAGSVPLVDGASVAGSVPLVDGASVAGSVPLVDGASVAGSVPLVDGASVAGSVPLVDGASVAGSVPLVDGASVAGSVPLVDGASVAGSLTRDMPWKTHQHHARRVDGVHNAAAARHPPEAKMKNQALPGRKKEADHA